MVDGKLPDRRNLRNRLNAFRAGGMKVVLVEPIASARTVLAAHLGGLGIAVASFNDAYMAFLFLLERLEDVDGVLVNADNEPQMSRLLRWLEMLPRPSPS